MTQLTREYCEALDRDDPLAALRCEFKLPADTIYLDGNSLGAMPRAALERAREVIEREWGEQLIESWNSAGWYDKPRALGDRLASLIGAAPGEVLVTDSTGINLFKVLAAALALRQERHLIVMEGSNFPTNNYIAQGLVSQLHGRHAIRFVEAEDIAASLDETVAVLCLTHVHFKSGRIHDMADLTRRAHDCGALVVWDLCHSAGAMPVDLEACQVDFAVGCTYKYLNGGPGSPAYLFVARRHQGRAEQPLTGWWSHAEPFAFESSYRPANDLRQMLCGTQPILSLCVAEAGIELACRADMQQVRYKSQGLTRLFIELVERRCAEFRFRLASPREDELRGSQVSFDHEQGYAIVRALIDAGVVGDFRAPDTMRFGFAPLYLRYVDIWEAVERLRLIMESERWREPRFQVRSAVT